MGDVRPFDSNGLRDSRNVHPEVVHSRVPWYVRVMKIRQFAATAGVAGLALAGWGLLAFEAERDGMDGMRSLVRNRFPLVRQLDPAAAAAWLAATNAPRPQLLDVRTEAEFRVSHIPGARRVDPEASGAEAAKGIDPSRPILVYCAVGYRSSELATRLLKSGLTNVANLEGSIFAWANEGRPLEADGRPVTRVHPYNSTFGRLLKPEHRAVAEDLP